MPVWFKNFQHVLFNEGLLKVQTNFLLHLLGVGHFDVSLVCVTSEEIQHLNKVYRNKDTPTDVLSFEYHKITVPGKLPDIIHEWDNNLGDILLGVPVIEEVCECEGVRLLERLPVLVTHGLCHLIGHRHDNPQNWTKMTQAESRLLTSLNKTFGTNLEPLTELKS